MVGLVLLVGVPVNAVTVDEARENASKKYDEYIAALTEYKNVLADGAYQIGDSVSFTNGIIIKIDNVTNATAGMFYADEVKGQYIKIDFTIDNTSSEEKSVNSHMFSFYDAERIATEHTSEDYFSANIAPNMRAQGSVYYDVKNSGVVSLFVSDAIWSFDTNSLN